MTELNGVGVPDLEVLAAIAEEVVDEADAMFTAGLGADPSELKGAGDFATEVDQEIEAAIRSMLEAETGIPVLGEEAGGTLSPELMWVVDPIDGTANYAAGNPLCAILVSLVVDHQPRLAVTSIPLLRRRFVTVEGQPVCVNGREVSPIADRDPLLTQVSVSAVASSSPDFPSSFRQEMLGLLTHTFLRPRITGSVGVDLALTAQGVFDGAVSFSPHLWDTAAGVAHLRAAGAIVTDLHGEEWTLDSVGVVAGTPRAHAELMSTIKRALSPQRGS